MSPASFANDALENYPLVDCYFGTFLRKLLRVRQEDSSYRGRFVEHAFYSEALEARLRGVESLGQTEAIVREVGDSENVQKLDGRLMDAWAEIRVLDQLQREGFQRICKTKETTDFTAEKDSIQYAFQVTHVSVTLESQVTKRNPSDLRDPSPFGEIDCIHKRLDMPASWLFWDKIDHKNADLRDWSAIGWRRCLVLVTNQAELQDPMVRHMVCRGLQSCIRALSSVNFEELLWLLDNGNGAWFHVDATDRKTRCLADWKDEFPGSGTDFRPADVSQVNRREVDLDSLIPAWIDVAMGRA